MNGTFFCNKCGAQNVASAQFCSRCGAPTNPAPVAPPPSASSPGFGSLNPSPSSPTVPSYAPVVPVAGLAYGGFWIRVVAAIIDFIILRIVVSPIKLIFGGLGLAGMMSGIHPVGLGVLGGGLTAIALIFGSWLYEAF